MSRLIRWVLLGVLVWGTRAAMAEAPATGNPVVLDRMRAVVGKEAVTQSELAGSAPLQSVIDRLLQLNAAQRSRVSVSDQEVEAAITEFRERTGLTTDEALRKALESEHLTLTQYQAGLREQLLVQKLLARDISHDLLVSESEVRSAYERDRQTFILPEEIRVAQILFSLPPKATAQEVAKTRERVKTVMEQLTQGADFTRLAVQHSDGPESARGGDLGYFRAGELLPDIEQAARRLVPGQVGPPLRTPIGFHLVKLLDVRPPRIRPFEEVRRMIEDRLIREKGKRLLHQWLIELRRRVFVEVKP